MAGISCIDEGASCGRFQTEEIELFNIQRRYQCKRHEKEEKTEVTILKKYRVVAFFDRQYSTKLLFLQSLFYYGCIFFDPISYMFYGYCRKFVFDVHLQWIRGPPIGFVMKKRLEGKECVNFKKVIMP